MSTPNKHQKSRPSKTSSKKPNRTGDNCPTMSQRNLPPSSPHNENNISDMEKKAASKKTEKKITPKEFEEEVYNRLMRYEQNRRNNLAKIRLEVKIA